MTARSCRVAYRKFQQAQSSMYITAGHNSVSDAAHLRLAEVATLKVWGDLYGLDVEMKPAGAGLSGEMAFIGFGDSIASWTVYWLDGVVWLAFLPNLSEKRCEGWKIAVGSVEEAMVRIIAATDD